MSEINLSSLNHTQKIQWLTEKKMEALGYKRPKFEDNFDPEAELAEWLANYNERLNRINKVEEKSRVSEEAAERKHQGRLAHIDQMRQQEKLEKEQLYQRIEELERKVDFLMNRETR